MKKIGINLLLWTTYTDEPLFPIFEQLKNLGYDGVEIPIDPSHTVEHYKKVAKAIHNAGLEATITTIGTPNSDMGSIDKNTQQAGIDHIKKVLDIAHILKAKVIGGPFHTVPSHFPENCPQDGEAQRIVENLKKVSSLAKQADIRLAIEVINRFEMYIMNTLKQAYDIVSQVKSEYLGIHCDSHHIHYEENSVSQALKDAGEYLFHMHWSESHRGILGTGQVQWDEYKPEKISSLKSDWIVLEGFSHKVPGVREAAGRWRNIFDDEIEFCRQSINFTKKLLK